MRIDWYAHFGYSIRFSRSCSLSRPSFVLCSKTINQIFSPPTIVECNQPILIRNNSLSFDRKYRMAKWPRKKIDIFLIFPRWMGKANEKNVSGSWRQRPLNDENSALHIVRPFIHGYISHTYALLNSHSIFKCVEGLVSVLWSLTLGTHFSSFLTSFSFIFFPLFVASSTNFGSFLSRVFVSGCFSFIRRQFASVSSFIGYFTNLKMLTIGEKSCCHRRHPETILELNKVERSKYLRCI